MLIHNSDLNNTWIYDQQTFCDPTIIFTDEICKVRRGSPYLEASSNTFSQSLDIIAAGGASQEETDNFGEEYGVPKLVSTSLAGTDTINFASSGPLTGYPVGIPRQAWDAGYTTLHSLGMGSNSTYLNYLKQAGKIGSRIWSIYWGRMWTSDNPLDGSVVVGGYDKSKVIGQNYTQALDYSATGCWTGMKVNIADLVLNNRNGTDFSLFVANTVLPVCIVPQRQLLLEAPSNIMGGFRILTGVQDIGVSFGLHWSAFLFNAAEA
jgi:hypothetical protein